MPSIIPPRQRVQSETYAIASASQLSQPSASKACYLNSLLSSRRLEHECQRNVKVMWLTQRLSTEPAAAQTDCIQDVIYLQPRFGLRLPRCCRIGLRHLPQPRDFVLEHPTVCDGAQRMAIRDSSLEVSMCIDDRVTRSARFPAGEAFPRRTSIQYRWQPATDAGCSRSCAAAMTRPVARRSWVLPVRKRLHWSLPDRRTVLNLVKLASTATMPDAASDYMRSTARKQP